MENYEKRNNSSHCHGSIRFRIGIVRISGENAIYIVDSIFRSASGKKDSDKVQSHMIHYGYIVDKDENIIDEVMTSVMKAPKAIRWKTRWKSTVMVVCWSCRKYWRQCCRPVPDWQNRVNSPRELFGRIDLSRRKRLLT